MPSSLQVKQLDCSGCATFIFSYCSGRIEVKMVRLTFKEETKATAGILNRTGRKVDQKDGFMTR